MHLSTGQIVPRFKEFTYKISVDIVGEADFSLAGAGRRWTLRILYIYSPW